MKKPKTYKVDHPIIKEISIGDKFILYNGAIITFVKYEENQEYFSFTMNEYTTDGKLIAERVFDDKLNNFMTNSRNVKYKLLTLKEKLELI